MQIMVKLFYVGVQVVKYYEFRLNITKKLKLGIQFKRQSKNLIL